MLNIAKVFDNKCLEEAKRINFDGYCFGDEFCFYKFKNVTKYYNEIKEFSKAGKMIFVAIPIIQQSHLVECKKICAELMQLGIKIIYIINDLGMLYYLKTEYKYVDYSVILGRLLNKNIESCPWSEHIIRNENDFIKKVMYTNSANSDIVIEHLNDLNVKGVHCNITQNQKASYIKLKEKGYLITADLGYTYVASSRVCITAHHKHIKVGDCSSICKSFIEVTLDKIKNVSDMNNSLVKSENAKELYGTLYVNGNCIFKKNSIEDVPKEIDCVMIDIVSYLNDLSKLEELICRIKSLD
ncbi:hypothetical protein [Ruminococcus sp. YE282]|uniref:hypothetical protein n=1 Tax=Ruminococcus sp. YE282 TaxID=3158780 RepID=UPI0008811B89|nr:hypothetical protein SAMN02910441_00654 [Ruminococcus bromii]